MKIEAKQRLLSTELNAADLLFKTQGFESRTWEGEIVGTDGKDNNVWVVSSDSEWMVVIHDGKKMVAMLSAKDEQQARAAAKKAVDDKAKTYWSNKDPLLNYYLNNAGRIKVTVD